MNEDLIFPIIQLLKNALLNFLFYYPLFMAYLWMCGAIYYYFIFEKGKKGYDVPPTLSHYPGVALIVPCHNEEENVRETIMQLLDQKYPDFEIIAINDGSTDRTQNILDELAEKFPRVRVIHLVNNLGKAAGLNMAALLTQKEYLVGIDGDCLLDEHAVSWVMHHFTTRPRLGAITGNPRIRNRSTLFGKIQVGEFSSIIGLIKRAQSIYGRIFTVSGVISAFRKTALHDVGYWSTDMLTEDIDISWKMQFSHWEVIYEPNVLCWILMPETLEGLWKQRLRWSMGGVQVILKYFRLLFSWQSHRMWLIYVEFILSVLWSYGMFLIIALSVLGLTVSMPYYLYVPQFSPGWNGVILGTTFLLQIALSFFMDSRYEEKLWRIYPWMIWYPLVYWMLNMFTIVWAVPKTLFRNNKQNAIWTSPDRGLTHTEVTGEVAHVYKLNLLQQEES